MRRRAVSGFSLGLLLIMSAVAEPMLQFGTGGGYVELGTVSPYDGSAFVWTGASNSDWNNPANWSLGEVPFGVMPVIINSGTVTLTNAVPPLTALTINGGTLTFEAWEACLTAEEITFNGGTITHAANSAKMADDEGNWVPNARVWIICTNLTVAASATINANGKGFGGGRYNSQPALRGGFGPGAGGSKGRGGGGAYGGAGGSGATAGNDGPGGSAYGDAAFPDMPGSDGGAKNASTENAYGGDGGGCIRIEASGAVTLHGAITANGTTGNTDSGGGGSGGGINITCQTIAGSGIISANPGAASTWGGGGGGGRIAVRFASAAQCALAVPASVQLSAAHTTAATYRTASEQGTI